MGVDPVSEVWVETSDEVVTIGNREYRDVHLTIKPEWIDLIRNGYMCVVCFERFETAWPKRCTMSICQFPVAEHQAEVFARLYKGQDTWERWEPSPSEVEERASKSGIWVPRGV